VVLASWWMTYGGMLKISSMDRAGISSSPLPLHPLTIHRTPEDLHVEFRLAERRVTGRLQGLISGGAHGQPALHIPPDNDGQPGRGNIKLAGMGSCNADPEDAVANRAEHPAKPLEAR